MLDAPLQFEFPPRAAAMPAGAASSFAVRPENLLLVPPVRRLLDAADSDKPAGRFNPLVLVGPSGSGKSHLVQGIVRAWNARLEPEQIAYFTAADFGRERQAAEADDRLQSWRDQTRAVRLFVLEDLDRLRPRATIQQELRATVDVLVQTGCEVIVTARREPMTIPHLDAGLRDRLTAGLSVRIQRLSRGITADDATPHLPSPNSSPTSANGSSHTAALKQILAVTARAFGVTQAALTGPSRRAALVQPRNVVVHLARRLTGASYAEIGRVLGRRDHTTIMHADRRIAQQLAADPALQQSVDELETLLA